MTKLYKGGEYLLAQVSRDDVFTPEDLSDEQKEIARTAEKFAHEEVLPVYDRLEHQEQEALESGEDDGSRHLHGG